ncbi:YjcZ family sporulation protein [Paenibacillus sp. M1]|uniref:YjcZ family sporulation protein n=1 Tax=Paenibacillus haidiansis TaxID=1574488 RepID=A0ABU7VVK8_9BACL
MSGVVDGKAGGYGYPGGLWTSTGAILVLFILLVIISRAFVI